MEIEKLACPLCGATAAGEFSADKRRNYLQCRVCCLVFVPASQCLSSEDEKKRYDLHQNSPDDAGYRRFLGRLFFPLHERLAPGSSGLDFGSGPAPTLSRMFEEAGHSMILFDPYYENVPAVLNRQYDFITVSEVVEHLREPGRELDRLWVCLKRGGWLRIMTRFIVDRAVFPRWHYKNDLTHISFFSRAVFTWLAAEWNADVTFPEEDVVLFRKNKADKSAS